MSKNKGVIDRGSIVPSSFKQARACIDCGLVKTAQQFDDSGCENCEGATGTTQNFEGIIAIMNPGQSWIARRMRNDKKVPGLYALSMDSDSRR